MVYTTTVQFCISYYSCTGNFAIILMVENEEELKNLLMRVKEKSEKSGLKLHIQKTKIMASDPITSGQIEGGKVELVTDFYFLGLQNHCGW